MHDLPAALRERARAHLAAGPSAEVAPARDAATVLLLRDGPSGIEAYLLRRTRSMAFAAGMHVFPGGSVDARDADADIAWSGPPPGAWSGWLTCDEPLARALVCAAVRETFEESGVLLAGPGPAAVVDDTTSGDYERDRRALLDRSLSMAGLLARRALVLRSDLLRPWAHWITPEFEPRRFDTRFFVAAVPPGQRPRHVSTEADQARWLPVAEAVAGHDAGRLAMLAPTIVSLRELTRFATVERVLAAVREVRPVLPRLVQDGDRLALSLGDASAGGTYGEQP